MQINELKQMEITFLGFAHFCKKISLNKTVHAACMCSSIINSLCDGYCAKTGERSYVIKNCISTIFVDAHIHLY
jgi:hypothetical protein